VNNTPSNRNRNISRHLVNAQNSILETQGADSCRLTMKYIDPIQKYADDYYIKNIKRKAE